MVYYFCMKNRLSKIHFSKAIPQKNAEVVGSISSRFVGEERGLTKRLEIEPTEVVNLKNPDLDLSQSNLLEWGYFGFMTRFWISPKKNAKSVFVKNNFCSCKQSALERNWFCFRNSPRQTSRRNRERMKKIMFELMTCATNDPKPKQLVRKYDKNKWFLSLMTA